MLDFFRRDSIQSTSSSSSFKIRPHFKEISLTLAFLGFFFNTITISPFSEFEQTMVSPIGGDVNLRVKSAMSIISVGFGGFMSFYGIWVKSKRSWRVNAFFGFIAWASFTVFSAYETSETSNTGVPSWWIAFGWAGVVCYGLAVIFAGLYDRASDGE